MDVPLMVASADEVSFASLPRVAPAFPYRSFSAERGRTFECELPDLASVGAGRFGVCSPTRGESPGNG